MKTVGKLPPLPREVVLQQTAKDKRTPVYGTRIRISRHERRLETLELELGFVYLKPRRLRLWGVDFYFDFCFFIFLFLVCVRGGGTGRGIRCSDWKYVISLTRLTNP